MRLRPIQPDSPTDAAAATRAADVAASRQRGEA